MDPNYIFPKLPKGKYYKYTSETAFSSSSKFHAKLLGNIISKNHGKDIIITDLTAHIGGNAINLALMKFKKVYANEYSEEAYNALKHNIHMLQLDNIIPRHTDSSKKENVPEADVYFIDPPWGGIDYKNKDTIPLYIGRKKVKTIVNFLWKRPKTKGIYIKAPVNYENLTIKDAKKIPMYNKSKTKILYYILQIIKSTSD